MHRHLYSFAVFLNIVIALIATAEAGIFSTLGTNMYYLEVYPNWVLGGVVLATLEAVIMLRYLGIKKYTVAFRTGICYYIVVVATLLYNYLLVTIGVGTQVYVPLSLLALALQIVYGFGAMITVPREKTWLRVAGGYAGVIGVTSLGLTLLVLLGASNETHSTLEKFHGPVLWANAIPSLLLVLHFYRELRSEPKEHTESPAAYTFGYPILAMATLYLIVSFTGGAIGMKKWLPEMETSLKKVAEPFEALAYVDSEGDSLKYRLFKPLNFDPSKSYPIIVCLHGSSGTGNDNYKQVAASVFPEFLTSGSNPETYQAFIFVPQCPFGTSWGGIHPLPGIDEVVFEAMASLEKELPIDTTRRYVAGVSLGGYGAWHFIEARPDVFAAAIPLCGVGDPANASKCADVPVWAFHGAKDNRVPVSGSRDMIKALKEAGGNPKYTEYPDTGHDIGKLVTETPGLLDWLFAQQRTQGQIQ